MNKSTHAPIIPPPHWIPTSSNYFPDIEYTSPAIEQSVNVLIQLKKGYIDVGWTVYEDDRLYWSTNCNNYRLSDVVAWMPLPELYKEGNQ